MGTLGIWALQQKETMETQRTWGYQDHGDMEIPRGQAGTPRTWASWGRGTQEPRGWAMWGPGDTRIMGTMETQGTMRKLPLWGQSLTTGTRAPQGHWHCEEGAHRGGPRGQETVGTRAQGHLRMGTGGHTSPAESEHRRGTAGDTRDTRGRDTQRHGKSRSGHPPEAASLPSVRKARSRGSRPAPGDPSPAGAVPALPGCPLRKRKQKRRQRRRPRDSPWSRYHGSAALPLPVRPFLYPSRLGPQRPPPTGGTGTAPRSHPRVSTEPGHPGPHPPGPPRFPTSPEPPVPTAARAQRPPNTCVLGLPCPREKGTHSCTPVSVPKPLQTWATPGPPCPGLWGPPHVPIPGPPPSPPPRSLQGWQCHHSVLCPSVPGTTPTALARHPPHASSHACVLTRVPPVTPLECPHTYTHIPEACPPPCSPKSHAYSCVPVPIPSVSPCPSVSPIISPYVPPPHTHTKVSLILPPSVFRPWGGHVSVGVVALGGDGASGQEDDEDEDDDAHEAEDDEQLHVLPPVAPGHLLGRCAEML